VKNFIIVLSYILLSGFSNFSYGQETINYDLECLETPYHVDFIYHDKRIICEDGVSSLDSTINPCKDLYYQSDISMWTLYYLKEDSVYLFDEMNIIEEDFQETTTKVIELKEALVRFKMPTEQSVQSVSFDLIDISNGGINFTYNYGGWFANYYDSVDEMLEAVENEKVIQIGNRIHIQDDSISTFHIGGDHIKVANIAFNEEIDNTTSSKDFTKLDISIFPNPVQDILQIDAKSNTIKSLQIFDSLGKLVFQTEQSTRIHEINTSNWNYGIYWVNIINDKNESYSHKVVKQ
jgi:hypothetical protein